MTAILLNPVAQLPGLNSMSSGITAPRSSPLERKKSMKRLARSAGSFCVLESENIIAPTPIKIPAVSPSCYRRDGKR
eukprot:TRINITY_DN59969_c0_g1_i1.p1 TRINITY_DN59969_c0_g1~~TRINITY_DN59969_c0_g1_i1.p1  ORF type:complete len:77 (+),score=15.76 TRINITY_DN59969_c0_g1_i1:157-387(+)